MSDGRNREAELEAKMDDLLRSTVLRLDNENERLRAEIERLRAALRGIRDEIIYGGGDMIEGPDIDKLHDIARAALAKTEGQND
jgi:hypothetical protein